MRAVVIATGNGSEAEQISLGQVMPLLPCVDRPALQHIVEFLVESGVRQFDFVLHDSPEVFEKCLGDGARWGASFTFQLARSADRPFRILKLLQSSEMVVLVDSSYLPILSLDRLNADTGGRSALFCTRNAESEIPTSWTGWALLDPATISRLPDNPTRVELEAALVSLLGRDKVEFAPETYEFGTLNRVIETQRCVLTNALPGVHLSARQVEPGIWIGRNVSIHPTASLTGPLFIGENSRIGAAVRLGPNASVGHDTVIDRNTSIKDATVLPGSYCGEGLELDRVIIDRNRLINIDLHTQVHISDSFILSSIRGRRAHGLIADVCSRFLASVLLVMGLPLLAIVWIARRRQVTRRDVVCLPAEGEPGSWALYSLYSFRRVSETTDAKQWCAMVFDILPNLIQVARGRLRLVGVQPRTPDEIEQLPSDWRSMYLKAHGGLITEARVMYGTAATDDELYSSEVYYAAMSGLRHDVGLAWQFLSQAVRHV